MVSLALDQISARYGRREILTQASTPPMPGGVLTALVGANAAGKSTLFRRIAGQLGGPAPCACPGQRRMICATCRRILR